MVYAYKRKTERASWSVDAMRNAILSVKNGNSLRKVSMSYNIPKSTLMRHVKSGNPAKKLGRFTTVFTPEMERQIADHITKLDSIFYGLTLDNLKALAFELAEKNGVPHPFGHKAGDGWVKGFLNRHPHFSLRKPEPTSIGRATGFNRVQVQRFFDLLHKLLADNHFRSSDIWNVDESGFQTSAKRPPKVIAAKGKKQVGIGLLFVKYKLEKQLK